MMDRGACSTIFEEGAVQFDLEDNFEPDSEDEDDKRRKAKLDEKLESAFNDLESEIFHDSSDYSTQNSYLEDKSQTDCNEGTNYNEQCHSGTEIRDIPIWGNDSDNSGNFPTHEEIYESPTQFNLHIDNVNSEESLSLRCSNVGNPQMKVNAGQKYKAKSDLLQCEFLNCENSYDQLQCLYETRGKELERVVQKVAEQENVIMLLTSDSDRMKGKLEILSISNKQYKMLLGEQETKIRSLQSDLKEKEENIKTSNEANKQISSKLEIAESTIISLELQVTELTSSDCFRKSEESEAKFTHKLAASNKDEVINLRRKLKESSQQIIKAENQIINLEAKLKQNSEMYDKQLLEKGFQVSDLKKELCAAEQLMQISNPVNSISEYLDREKSLIEEINTLKERLNLTEKELKSYDSLIKIGVFKSLIPHDNDLNIENMVSCANDLSFTNDGNKSKASQENVFDTDSIKQELIKCVVNNKTYREEIRRLHNDSLAKQKQLQILKSELKSIRAEEIKDTTPTYCNENTKAIFEDNISLMEQNATLIKNFSLIKETSEKLLCSLKEVCDKIQKSSVKNLYCIPFTSLLDSLNSHSVSLENFKAKQHQIWDKMRLEIIKEIDQSLLIKNLNNILKSLENLRLVIKISDFTSDNIYAFQLNQIIEKWKSDIKNVTEETCCITEENSRLRKQLSGLQLNYNLISDEFLIVQKQKEEQIERDHLNALENCKVQYLKFHEESIQEVKGKLQKEYEMITDNLKVEIDRMTKKLTDVQNDYVSVCKEKNLLEEEMQLKMITVNKHDSQFDLCVKENMFLRATVEDLELKLNERKKQLEANHNVSTAKDCQQSNVIMVENSTNTENLATTKNIAICQEKFILLQTESKMLKLIFRELKASFENELQYLVNKISQFHLTKDLQLNSSDSERKNNFQNFSDKIDAVERQMERYKSLSENCKEEKSNYEQQILDKEKQLNNLTSMFITNIVPLKEKLKQLENEKKLFVEKVNQLTQKVKSFEEIKQRLLIRHEEEIKIITDELQNQESNAKELKNQWELKLHEHNKVIYDLGLDREKLAGELNALKKTMTVQQERLELKYKTLKDKSRKLQNNFTKYRTNTDERINYLLNKAKHFKESKIDVIASFKEWASKTRGNLIERLSFIINQLNALQENTIVKPADLDYLLLNLNLLFEKLQKIHVYEA